MAPSPPNHSTAAVEQLSRGYEQLTQLHALLSSSPDKPSTTEPAVSLLDKALGCVATALSELQAGSPGGIDASAVEDIKNDSDLHRRNKKKMQSWTIVTSAPHFDGHQWRKYGQKRILNSEFPRSYYKCAQSKDQGCPATKAIQQKKDEISDSPKYDVSYTMQHTCKARETLDTPFVMESLDNSKGTATASSACSSNELMSTSSFHAPSLYQPLSLPSQNEDIEQTSLMESMLLSAEFRGEASIVMSPLPALDFDWDWLISRSELDGIVV